ncbi:MAG: hypothetical protein H5T69_07270, partial [Chloroflexi bacterium]|nr:hypothetical protein [Chloroflexota bacterium]
MRVALLGLLITVGLIKPTASASPAKETGALAPLPTMVPGPELGLKPTSGYARGYRPPRANVGHLSVRNQLARPQLAQPLPSRWDWRDQAAVTGVRNQGECGSCYAFAGLGSLEAQLLIRGAGLYDFSENNIAECSYEPAGCEGGNIWIVANRLSSYGAVAESCDPYNPATQPCKTTCPPIKMVDEVWILGDSSVPDTTLLKTWLYRYGPLYVTMDSGSTSPTWDQEFAQYKGRYTLYHPDIIKLDHAVLLVGWDDNLIHAGGSGAWIVKNSWGVNWGAGGYFTMAYGSAGLGSNPALIAGWHEPKSAERLLFLDEGGWQREYGWMSQLGAWGMVRLIPSQSGCIDQVELWTTDRTRQVDVYLYDSFDGQAPSGLLRQLPRQAFEFPGYHK